MLNLVVHKVTTGL